MSDLENSRFKPMLQALESGSLTPSQLSTVSQALHIGLLNSALTSIQEADSLLGSLKTLEDRAMEFLPTRFEEFITSASYSDIMQFMGSVAAIRSESVKAKLKVYSTRDLFNINPVSEDDRALLTLFKMIDSDSKKQKLRDFLSDLTSDAITVPYQDVDGGSKNTMVDSED